MTGYGPDEMLFNATLGHDPIPDHTFLGERAYELCEGKEMYWLKSSTGGPYLKLSLLFCRGRWAFTLVLWVAST